MNKSYFYALDETGIFLSLLYMIVLIGALIYIAKLLKVGFSKKAITSLFIYYYLFFIFSTLMPFIPDLPDTELFSRMITDNFFPWYQSLGVRLFYGITYPIRVLSLFKLELFILFQISIFMIALMILWKSWQIVLEKNAQDENLGVNVFLFLAGVYPAFLLYIPIPLREFFILLGFSILVYGLIDRYYNNKGLLYIVLGSIFLLFGRPQLIVIVIIFLALFQKSKWIKYSLVLSSIFMIPLLFTTLMPSFQFNPEFFAYLRNHSLPKFGALAYGEVEWHTYGDILVDLPTLFLQFLFSPMPVLHDRNPITFFAIFVDSMFSILIYLGVIYAGIKVSKVYIFIFLISAILFSIWEFHIAGAARHRMPLVAILLPVASYGILKFFQDIKAKI